jgi:integrase
VAQVFELADRVGVRPVGNIHKRVEGYRLRYRVTGGRMRTFPEPFATRALAEKVLWLLMYEGRADSQRDTRFRALVLLTAFASLRWGEVTALRRCDIDTDTEAGTVRVQAAYVELSNGQMILGPPKSRAGLRTVSIPAKILPDVTAHLAKHTAPASDALVFTGLRGGPLRWSGWNKATGWPHVVASLGAEGLHFHDLRHTGNTLAADMGVSLRSLMARMGHDNERAALMYQHKSAASDRKIADGLNKLVEAEQDHDDDGAAGALVPVA